MNSGTENRKSKAGAAVGAALGAVALLAGLVLLLYSLLGNRLETNAVSLDSVEKADTFAYARIQYMTASFAYYEASRDLQFYIAFDEEFNPAILCVKNQDLPHYQPYIDWMYSSSNKNEPEAVNAAGYSQRIDSELKSMVLDVANEVFGEGVVDTYNFSQVFGDYYLNVGPKSSAYGYGTAGIILMIAGLLASVLCGVRLLHKEKEPQPGYPSASSAAGSLRERAGYMPQQSEYMQGQSEYMQGQSGYMPEQPGYVQQQNPYDYTYASQNAGTAGSYTVPYTEPEKGSRALGILGAVIGALLGGLIWAVVGAFGLISGWIGLLIVVMAIKGYQLLSRREDDKFGTVIAVILGLIVIAPATYLSGAWSYYRELNKVIPGYISFWEAAAKMPEYLSEYNEWGTMLQNMVMGYVFAGIASLYFVAGMFGKNKKNR